MASCNCCSGLRQQHSLLVSGEVNKPQIEIIFGDLLLFLQFLDVNVEFTVESELLNLWKQICKAK